MVVLYIPCFYCFLCYVAHFRTVLFYFLTVYLSCVKALCCTLIKHTKKNLLKRMQTGFVIRTHMGTKATTDIAAFISLVSDPQKPRNSKTNLKFTNTVWLLFSCAYRWSDSLKMFFILWQPMPNTISQVSTLTWMFPLSLASQSPLSKYMEPSLIHRTCLNS